MTTPPTPKPDDAETHNPAGLTPEQVGEGYRLLTVAELDQRILAYENGDSPEKVDGWTSRGPWVPSWNGNSRNVTYRVPVSTPEFVYHGTALDAARSEIERLTAEVEKRDAECAAIRDKFGKLVAIYEKDYDDAGVHRPAWVDKVLQSPSGQALLDRLSKAEGDAAKYDFLRRFDHFSAVDSLLEGPCNTLDEAVSRAMQREEKP